MTMTPGTVTAEIDDARTSCWSTCSTPETRRASWRDIKSLRAAAQGDLRMLDVALSVRRSPASRSRSRLVRLLDPRARPEPARPHPRARRALRERGRGRDPARHPLRPRARCFEAALLIAMMGFVSTVALCALRVARRRDGVDPMASRSKRSRLASPSSPARSSRSPARSDSAKLPDLFSACTRRRRRRRSASAAC